MKMTPEAEQFLLNEWSNDPFVGNETNDRNDRLARAIILDGRLRIAKGHGFNTHAEYLANHEKQFQIWNSRNS